MVTLMTGGVFWNGEKRAPGTVCRVAPRVHLGLLKHAILGLSSGGSGKTDDSSTSSFSVK